jgi:hypothetical protein
MELNQAILTAIIGSGTGALESFVAPWVKWGIEKRKIKLKNRAQTINNLKSILPNEVFDRKKTVNHDNYYAIRKHLSDKSIDALETNVIRLYGSVGDSPFNCPVNFILDDLSKLEIKWGLR